MRRLNTVPRTDHYKAAYYQQMEDIGKGGRVGGPSVAYRSSSENDDWYGGPKSKVGSWDNWQHLPKPSNVKIENRKFNWQTAPKVGSLENYYHEPGGGKGKIFQKSTDWVAGSKVGSLDYIGHVPQGGDKKIETRRLKWETGSKVGSLDNIGHVPQSHVIPLKDKTQKINWKGRAKVGSLENYHHAPGGGKGQIFDEKLDWQRQPRTDTRNVEFDQKQKDRKELAELRRKRMGLEAPIQLAPGSKYHDVLPPIRRKLTEKDNAVWSKGPDQERFEMVER